MFRGATTFNRPIGSWDVSNVTDMSWMFEYATAFDQEKVANFIHASPDRMESIQVLHYEPGQKYNPHYDGCNDGCDSGNDMPRLSTFFIYLNDVEAGGETEFPKVGVHVNPKRGRACLWNNIDPVTKNNLPCSLHGGKPVVRGEKWACNIWIR
jgi:prolyl 4-hydroxylase